MADSFATELGGIRVLLERQAEYANLAVANAARHVGAIGVQIVRSYASGRPGPEKITGAYLASIKWEFDGLGGGMADLRIGSDADQSNRLEFGFSGVDSIGRNYHQPPFPHFAPAMDQMEQMFADAVDESLVMEELL